MLLSVFLGAERVGEITVLGESVEFRLVDGYRSRYPRPILGQVFEDDPELVHRSRVKLPPFFSNLLPEGALRELLARQIGVKAEREPYLIAFVGEDLPGAVRVVVDDETGEVATDEESEPRDQTTEVLKFSLAGVQLKLSAIRAAGRGLTIPAHGRGGDWIVKLPDTRYRDVPENEWAMMTLARAAGLRAAEVELVPVSEIHGLPAEIEVSPGVNALAVRRFDRAPTGDRIHIEDFAQVLNVRPSYRLKYRSANFETLARIVEKVATKSIDEFVRRLVFNIAIGNGDAHIKNWSLWYEDPMRASLAPAYDLVSTIQYIHHDDLGLNLGKSKAFSDVTAATFARLKDKAELSLDAEEVSKAMVARIRAAWSEHRSALPLSEEGKRRIEDHWRRVPLMNE
jgi:serine/threonine-protein kinase HipA